MTPPIPGDYYYHFKHFTQNPTLDIRLHVYKVIGVAGDAHEDQYQNRTVIYEPVFELGNLEKYQITCCSRPLVEFMEVVSRDGYTGLRFIKIEIDDLAEILNDSF